MPIADAASGRAGALAHLAAASGCALLLFAVGQPIFTDDFWWHLALGEHFAAHGPWLAEDPLLFAPAASPSPASWLFDVGIAEVARHFGFHALRALHGLFVAGILVLAWCELRRASRSPVFASLATLAFAALSALRLVQLRPGLFSIAASLLLYRWLVAGGTVPSWPRIALAAATAGVWANVHAGFPLGPMWIAAASAGCVAGASLRPVAERSVEWQRAKRLFAASGLAFLATLANPAGIGAHLAYLRAGDATPALDVVVDEWAPFPILALPTLPGPPSPLSWALAWIVALGFAIAFARALARARRGSLGFDPALAAISLLAIALPISAVRFLWLAVFPLLFIGQAIGARGRRGASPRIARRRAVACAAASVALASIFPRLGDWVAISRGAVPAAYDAAYPVSKYSAHAIWLLADSGVEGNLYSEYFLGGFAGYWLAPEVRTLVNGTLNFSRETLEASHEIARRRGQHPDEDFPELLDRLGIDLFLGIGMPDVRIPGIRRRYWIPTTTHLEDVPGWIPIYRSMDAAIYLRANERNRENVSRLVRFYREQGVPFDRERGFEVDAVLRVSPRWAIRHGVVPRAFLGGVRREATGGAEAASVRDRVAATWALLGEYERAVQLDRRLLRDDPEAVRPRRRLVWSLLSLALAEEAAAAAAALEERPESDRISHLLALAARQALEQDAAEARAARVDLPWLYPREGRWIGAGVVPPEIRPPRR